VRRSRREVADANGRNRYLSVERENCAVQTFAGAMRGRSESEEMEAERTLARAAMDTTIKSSYNFA
jgi:hypothetical protein